MTLSVSLWCAPAKAAEIYKSVDAAGHVTYSDQPATPAATVLSEPIRDRNEYADVAEMTATTAPPELPTRDQPPCPDDGDIWTPGYWSWDGATYFWQPGAWVYPPQVGVFWTPGYWEYTGRVFVFHRGYWGPQVGYYGGINYGFGYWGSGYAGGHWMGREFAYNRALNNVKGHDFRHVYDEPVNNARGTSRLSYNGGPGGTNSLPSAQERFAERSRLPAQPQREHLQVVPSPGPSMATAEHHYQPPTRALVPEPSSESAPARSVSNGTSRQRATAASVNHATPAPTKPSRPRATPTTRLTELK
ncbi:MAG TPA: DUF4124 domain-containing protein [Steroidobacteraceae bacterium]|nr:DUF4124 domain-containing protein [Steroidobacteraceae bacterium]